MKNSNQKYTKRLLAVVLMLSLSACGGPGSDLSGEGTGSPGDDGFTPNPEDIFELPNIIPNLFDPLACPDYGDEYIQKRDLKVEASSPSPGVLTYDYDGDGTDDSLLLEAFDPNPISVTIEVSRIASGALPVEEIETVGTPMAFVGGYEADETNMQPFSEITPSFGSPILEGSFLDEPTNPNPVLRQHYVPGTPFPGFSNQPFFPTWGFEGTAPFPNVECANNETIALCPGVHIIAAHFTELTPDSGPGMGDPKTVTHCTKQVWRLIVCPVEGICDVDPSGNIQPQANPGPGL